jgi:hypothetical protein
MSPGFKPWAFFLIGEKCVPHFSQMTSVLSLGAPAKSAVFAG